jgi:hypothetical protein
MNFHDFQSYPGLFKLEGQLYYVVRTVWDGKSSTGKVKIMAIYNGQEPLPMPFWLPKEKWEQCTIEPYNVLTPSLKKETDVKFTRSVVVPIEIAHHSVDGVLHGHTLIVEVSTRDNFDLDTLKSVVMEKLAFMENGPLEDTVGRTFEDIAARVLSLFPEAYRVSVHLPSRGHTIEALRE